MLLRMPGTMADWAVAVESSGLTDIDDVEMMKMRDNQQSQIAEWKTAQEKFGAAIGAKRDSNNFFHPLRMGERHERSMFQTSSRK